MSKGLRLDSRDQPLPISSLPDFSNVCRYCSFVIRNSITNGNDYDRFQPVLLVANQCWLGTVPVWVSKNTQAILPNFFRGLQTQNTSSEKKPFEVLKLKIQKFLIL